MAQGKNCLFFGYEWTLWVSWGIQIIFQVLCAKVVGATSSEGFMVTYSNGCDSQRQRRRLIVQSYSFVGAHMYPAGAPSNRRFLGLTIVSSSPQMALRLIQPILYGFRQIDYVTCDMICSNRPHLALCFASQKSHPASRFDAAIGGVLWVSFHPTWTPAPQYLETWRHPQYRKYVTYRNAARGGQSDGHKAKFHGSSFLVASSFTRPTRSISS